MYCKKWKNYFLDPKPEALPLCLMMIQEKTKGLYTYLKEKKGETEGSFVANIGKTTEPTMIHSSNITFTLTVDLI
jgi:hypothetical protein